MSNVRANPWAQRCRPRINLPERHLSPSQAAIEWTKRGGRSKLRRQQIPFHRTDKNGLQSGSRTSTIHARMKTYPAPAMAMTIYSAPISTLGISEFSSGQIQRNRITPEPHSRTTNKNASPPEPKGMLIDKTSIEISTTYYTKQATAGKIKNQTTQHPSFDSSDRIFAPAIHPTNLRKQWDWKI